MVFFLSTPICLFLSLSPGLVQEVNIYGKLVSISMMLMLFCYRQKRAEEGE